MAYRKPGEPARTLPQQQGVAEAARRDSADLGAEIEAVIEHVGQFATGGLGGAPIAIGQLAIARPGTRVAGRPRWRRHNRGQKPRAEPEFAVKRDVQRALRESAQPGMADPPIFELVADGFDQGLADAPPLPLRAHRDRPEKAETAPARREIRADQLAVQLRSKARDVLGPEPAIDIVAISPEILRIRRAQERPESGAADTPRLRQIGTGQWSDHRTHFPSLSRQPRRAQCSASTRLANSTRSPPRGLDDTPAMPSKGSYCDQHEDDALEF